MLTAREVQHLRRRRPPPSLRQRWQEYILQRIEGYKNSLARDELLRIGDEAVAELEATVEGQFLLTEVLMQDTVDRMIWRRLGLKPYRQWASQYRAVRAAQQSPTHWGIDQRCPVSLLLPRIEPHDAAVVIGAGAECYAYLLAACDMAVTFIAGDLACVERVESRMIAESLAEQFSAYVAQLGHWLPDLDGSAHLVVMDAGSLQQLAARDRQAMIRSLQASTLDGGVHIIVPGLRAFVPEAFLTLYPDWSRETPKPARRRSGTKSLGVLLTKPVCQSETASCVS